MNTASLRTCPALRLVPDPPCLPVVSGCLFDAGKHPHINVKDMVPRGRVFHIYNRINVQYKSTCTEVEIYSVGLANFPFSSRVRGHVTCSFFNLHTSLSEESF